jgi:amino acid adenylation domain-containing protein
MVSQGLRTGDMVGVCLERDTELIVALIAILKSGACYVPLDPAYPASRLQFMVADANVSLVISRGHPGFKSGLHASSMLFLDQIDLDRLPATPPNVRVRSGELAYVIYTSGSTGRPKGVAVEHRSVVDLVRWARAVFTPRELSGVLASTSVSFDVSVFEIFCTLCLGGRFILARNILDLPDLTGADSPYLISTVPSAMNELLHHAQIPPSVHTVCLAGEALSRALADRVYQLPHVRRLLNLYGPSEDTAFSTWAEIPRHVAGNPPIGYPLPRTRAYVLDDQLHAAAPGEAGELYLAGAGLARGYLHRPAETAAKFLPDPFAPAGHTTGSARVMYRTGDRVRQRPDGQLEFIGRVDDQVKFHGHRIELGEVAAALVSCAGVRDAAAAVVTWPNGDDRLIGYVVWDGPGRTSPDLDALARDVRSLLPRPMVPATLVVLDELPRLPNGKTDRSALPAPRSSPAAARDAAVTRSSDDIAQEIAAIWRELLGSPVDRDSNFLAAGGDSLLTLRLSARLRARLGVLVSVADIFRHSSPSALARHVRDAKPSSAELEAFRVTDMPPGQLQTQPYHLLLPAQRSMFFMQKFAPDDTQYLLHFAIYHAGPIDHTALNAALGDVMAWHPELRAGFLLREDIAVARISTDAMPPIKYGELQPGESLQQAMDRMAAGDDAPMDIGTPPLLRIMVLDVGNRAALLLTVHHIVFDDWSLGVFVRDLGTCYDLRRQQMAVTAPHTVHPGVLAARRQTWLASSDGIRALDELVTSLEGASHRVDLPTELARPAVLGSVGGQVRRSISPELAQSAHNFAQRHGVTLYMVGLAAFAALIWQWSGQYDTIIGTAFAARVDVDSEDVISCFVNTVPVRMKHRAGLTFAGLVEASREAALFAADHQAVPLERVIERLRPQRSLGYSPLIQVAFGVQNAGRARYPSTAPRWQAVELGVERARLDLTLWLDHRGKDLSALWTFNAALFTPAGISKSHRAFVRLLTQMLEHPNAELPTRAKNMTPRYDSAVSGSPGGWQP